MAGNDSNTVFLAHFNSDYSDSSSYNHIPTAAVTTIDTATKKFGAGSLKCVSWNSWVSYPDSACWYFTGNFTIEGWFNFIATPTYLNHLIGQGTGMATDPRWRFDLFMYNLYFFAYSGGYTAYYSCPWAPVAGTFHHIAFIREGDDAYCFIDGESQTLTVSVPFGSMPQVAYPFEIGGAYHDLIGYAYYCANAYIDEVRISNCSRFPERSKIVQEAKWRRIHKARIVKSGTWKDIVDLKVTVGKYAMWKIVNGSGWDDIATETWKHYCGRYWQRVKGILETDITFTPPIEEYS